MFRTGIRTRQIDIIMELDYLIPILKTLGFKCQIQKSNNVPFIHGIHSSSNVIQVKYNSILDNVFIYYYTGDSSTIYYGADSMNLDILKLILAYNDTTSSKLPNS